MKTVPIPGAAVGMPESATPITVEGVLSDLDRAMYDACNFAKVLDYLVEDFLSVEENGHPVLQSREAGFLLFISCKARLAAEELEDRLEAIRTKAVEQRAMS